MIRKTLFQSAGPLIFALYLLFTILPFASLAFAQNGSQDGLTMDFREADIRNVLRIIAQSKGLNIIAGQDVQGTVTVHFNNVSLVEALDAILTVNGFTYESVGNIIKVLPIEKFNMLSAMEAAEKPKTRVFQLQYADASAAVTTLKGIFSEECKIIADNRSNSIVAVATSRALADISELIEVIDREISVEDKIESEKSKTEILSRVYTFNHADAEDIQAIVRDMLPSNDADSKVIVDKRTNSLLLVAAPSVIALVEQYLGKLDTKAKQVMIEARILEVNLTDNESLGIEWQWSENSTTAVSEMIEDPRNPGTYLKDPKTGLEILATTRTNSRPTTIGGTGGGAGTTGGTGGTGGGTSSGEATNYYSANQNLTTVNQFAFDNSLAMTMGGLMKFGRLSAVDFMTTLQMLRARGDTKLVSSPKVTTLNNKEARIVVREKEPYRSTQESTQNAQTVSSSVEYKDIPIELTVRPQINDNNVITMQVHAIIEEKTGDSKAITGTGNEPIISSREAQTSVLVPDGDTIVIGGLVKNRVIKSHSKFPVLGDLPLMGTMFRKTSTDDRKSELLIFITPQIIDESRMLRDTDVRQYINERMGRNVYQPQLEVPSTPSLPPGQYNTPDYPNEYFDFHDPMSKVGTAGYNRYINTVSAPPARMPEVQNLIEELRIKVKIQE